MDTKAPASCTAVLPVFLCIDFLCFGFLCILRVFFDCVSFFSGAQILFFQGRQICPGVFLSCKKVHFQSPLPLNPTVFVFRSFFVVVLGLSVA